MKIKMGFYDVDVTAHDRYGDKESDATTAFLTHLSVICDYAAQFMDEKACPSLCEGYRAESNEVWQAIKEVRGDV